MIDSKHSIPISNFVASEQGRKHKNVFPAAMHSGLSG
jgi:hypothetical protein